MTSNWRARGMPKQRQSLATRPVPVLTVKFAFAPSANPPAAFFACLAAYPQCEPRLASTDLYTAVGTRRKWGRRQESLGMVNQSFAPSLAPAGRRVDVSPSLSCIRTPATAVFCGRRERFSGRAAGGSPHPFLSFCPLDD